MTGTENTADETGLSLQEVKAQIMSNCIALWPILQNRNGIGRPDLNLITVEHCGKVYARVVYEKTPQSLGVIVRGPETQTQCEAYNQLLAMTEVILGEEVVKHTGDFEAEDMHTLDYFGNGYYVSDRY